MSLKIKDLPPIVQGWAYKNYTEQNIITESFSKFIEYPTIVLIEVFDWRKTNEGVNFWNNSYKLIRTQRYHLVALFYYQVLLLKKGKNGK